MSSNLIGRLEPYQLGSEDWDQYADHLDQYFVCNDIQEAKKVAVFLTTIGAPTYALLCNLVAPEKPATKTYPELTKALQDHLKPKPLVIAERFWFHCRSQAEGEEVSQYMAELRRLADRCAFGTYLEEALRDRLACGLRDEAVQKKLLTMEALTLTKAYATAHGEETAKKRASELQASVGQVHLASGGESRKATKSAGPPASCYRCGKAGHAPEVCFFKKQKCRACKKLGHIARMCRAKRQQTAYLQEEVDTEEEATDEASVLMNIRMVKPLASKEGMLVSVVVDGKPLTLELDTGASVSLVSEVTWNKVFPERELQSTPVRLTTYTGENIRVLGQKMLTVEYEGQQKHVLPLVVVEGNGPSLFGRNWLEKIVLNWGKIQMVQSALQQLLQQHQDLFKDELGTVTGVQATLELKAGARPRFCKARVVPYALKDAIGEDLDRLERLGIVEKVNYSDWATPLVPVKKADGSVRLCGDYRVTINPELQVDQYPMPTPEDLFATLAGGTFFSKIDLSQAYNQVLLDEESCKLVTVNTHKGLYRYRRLPFGVASAPALFQQIMERILQGLPQVVVYIDDILVTGKNEKEHLAVLEEVLKRLESHGLRLKRGKCQFLKTSVDYLGYHIDREGLHPMASKVAAIVGAPEPRNLKELRAFLGLINYYGKFVKNLSTLTHSLNKLLGKGVRWVWSSECRRAFKKLKDILASSEVLVHYDPKLPLRLDCDASAYGVGAVLSHRFPDGSDRPVAYASRTLNAAEGNYAQIEKEGLSLVFGVRKFHKYLYGRSFTLITDHKPLVSILGSKKGLPTLAAARIQRWALFLMGYQYSIEFRSTLRHANADGFSRLPLKSTESPPGASEEVKALNLNQINSVPLSAQELRKATSLEPILGKVLGFTMRGWPQEIPPECRPYYQHRDEFTVEVGCLLRGLRVVIPTKYRKWVLTELHTSHPGIVRMKGIARSRVWWPGIDRDIEATVQSCEACQSVRAQPAVSPLTPWPYPAGPWERIHVDFAGPFLGRMFFVVVDAYSKWLEVTSRSATTTEKTIAVLRDMFARYGLPQVLVSDNGPQFISQGFQDFMQSNGIRHSRSAPYHPATNGEAERFVQTFKNALRKGRTDEGTVTQKLTQFLLVNRSTPHSTTGVPPAELFMKRSLRTRLDLLHPCVKQHVLGRQEKQQKYHDERAKLRVLEVGQLVLARNVRDGPKWLQGRVVRKDGPVTYQVEVGGQLWKRHIDQLLACCGEDRTVAESTPPEPPLTITTDIPEGPLTLEALESSETRMEPVGEHNLGTPSPAAEGASQREVSHPEPEAGEPSPAVSPQPRSSETRASQPIKREYPRRNRRPYVPYDPSFK